MQEDEEPAEDFFARKDERQDGDGPGAGIHGGRRRASGGSFARKKKAKKDMGTGYEKTPSSFFPKYLYSILRWGSWQRNRRSLYARSVPWATTAISLPMKMATGPSRAELRTSLQAEAKAAAATHKVEFTNRNKLAGNSPRMGSMLLTDKDLSIRNFVICDR